MKVLVTGAAGFIGMHCAQRLMARGDEVLGVDNLSPYYSVELKRERLKMLPRMRFEQLDIADDERLSSRASAIIADGANEVLVSAASAWEVVVKNALGRIELPGGDPAAIVRLPDTERGEHCARRYCQAHMANLSSIYKASDAKIRAVWEFETSELFSDAERAALRLAYHASLVPNESTAEDFAALRKHFDDGQIVEIVASIALYGSSGYRWAIGTVTGLTAIWTFGSLPNDLWFLFAEANNPATVPFMGYQLLASPIFIVSGVLTPVGLGNASSIVPVRSRYARYRSIGSRSRQASTSDSAR